MSVREFSSRELKRRLETSRKAFTSTRFLIVDAGERIFWVGRRTGLTQRSLRTIISARAAAHAGSSHLEN